MDRSSSRPLGIGAEDDTQNDGISPSSSIFNCLGLTGLPPPFTTSPRIGVVVKHFFTMWIYFDRESFGVTEC